MRLVRIIGVLAACMVLSACSAIKLGYANLPELTYWWLDRHIDFESAQAEQVRADLARVHAWHRREELPRVIELLGRIEQALPGAVTPAQACGWVTQAQERVTALANQAEPAVVAHATGLTPAQLRHMARQFRKRNDEYRKDWIDISAADQKDKRFDQVLERSETIYGRLGEAQRAALRAALEATPFDARRALADRERRQHDILETLKRVSGAPGGFEPARRQMRALFDRMLLPTDATARQQQQALLEDGCRTFAALHASTTPAQREQAARRLRAWQRDLRELVIAP